MIAARFKTCFLLTSFLCVFVLLKAQDPIYSQYYHAPLQLNPAMAGHSYAPTIAANVRIQWPGINQSYNTYSLSYDKSLDNTNAGIGFSILNDVAGAGILRHTKVSGLYSYNLQLSNGNTIRGGVELGMIQKRLNWDLLTFGDALDPQYGASSPGGGRYPTAESQPGNTNKTVLDIGAGLVYASDLFYAGVAVDHLNNPSDEFLTNNEKNYPGIPVRYTLHGGMNFEIAAMSTRNQKSYISPNAIFAKQGAFTQLNLGLNAEVRSFLTGIAYRLSNTNGDAIILGAGARIGDWKLMYTFDYTISSLSVTNTIGSHELGLIYSLGRVNPKQNINNCFNIFN